MCLEPQPTPSPYTLALNTYCVQAAAPIAWCGTRHSGRLLSPTLPVSLLPARHYSWCFSDNNSLNPCNDPCPHHIVRLGEVKSLAPGPMQLVRAGHEHVLSRALATAASSPNQRHGAQQPRVDQQPTPRPLSTMSCGVTPQQVHPLGTVCGSPAWGDSA